MKKHFLFFSVLFFTVLVSGQQTADFTKLDSVLTQLNQTERFNGTVLYAEKGKVLYRKAFGVADFRTGQALTTHASFNLASVSKQFIAVSVLKLFELGKLKPDDPIKKYLPELSYDTITIRNLLTHTSGIPEYFELFQRYRSTTDTLDNESLVKLFARYKPSVEFAVNSKWNYCNTNYVLLSAIVERVSHQAMNDFFQQHIAKPLGLQETYVYSVLLPSIPNNHVYGFTKENGKQKLFDLTNMDGVTGDGNVYSSVEDLFIWEQSLYTEKILKKETMALAFQPVKLKDGKTYPYGFGWFIKKENESYSHTGGWQGFKNIICRDTKQSRTLILLSSGDLVKGIRAANAWFENSPVSVLSTQLITNVLVIDGTGTAARKASVRIEGNKIVEVGDLKAFPGEEKIDGGGSVLAPGFIDSHSHIGSSLDTYPDALACVSQGVTTIVSGQDGDGYSIDSIKAGIQRKPISINVAAYTGQTMLRELVMKKPLTRPSTDEELVKMESILKAEMEKGSLGLSTGLEYEGSYFSTRNEVLQLAKVAATAKGRYISHIRSEDIAEADALDEIIAIGREAKLPVQISHIKVALKDDWGRSSNILAQLQQARSEGVDITADCYPYDYWHSTLRVLFPKTDYTNPVSAQYAVDHTFDPTQSVMVRFAANTSYAGKTITEIAAMRKEKPAQTIMGLIAEASTYEKAHPEVKGQVAGIMGKSMTDEDVVNFLAWPNTNICSDGSNGGHPRGYGSFTRVLGYYVREKKIMSLETAIQKMTSLSAEHTGIKNRGLIAAGYFADLVLFDPATVKDNADIKNSKAISTGIEKVWVNGEIVFANGQSTKKYPGVFVSR